MNTGNLSFVDQLICNLDNCLRAIAGDQPTQRTSPAKYLAEPNLTNKEKRQSAGFMRVNHSGEVCAQALYQGQALAAQNSALKTTLLTCAAEETDHLAWCTERLKELNTHRSFLNGFWYGNSFLIGIAAGLAGDQWSLGFVEETEIQVGKHLQGHLNKVSAKDDKTRAILTQMQTDETQHADTARQHGAKPLPALIKKFMQLHAKVMTTLAYWI